MLENVISSGRIKIINSLIQVKDAQNRKIKTLKEP